VTAARTLLRSWLPPVVAAVVIFGGWEALLAVIRPDGFVLPPPSDIGGAVAQNFDAIVTATRVTGFIIVTGLLAGVVVGAIVWDQVGRARRGGTNRPDPPNEPAKPPSAENCRISSEPAFRTTREPSGSRLMPRTW